MAVLCSRLNAPALLRALADLSELFPMVSQDFQASGESYDMLDRFNHVFTGDPYVDIAFSARFIGGLAGVKIQLALAYGRHGGDPLTFATQKELDSAHLLTATTDHTEAMP